MSVLSGEFADGRSSTIYLDVGADASLLRSICMTRVTAQSKPILGLFSHIKKTDGGLHLLSAFSSLGKSEPD